MSAPSAFSNSLPGAASRRAYPVAPRPFDPRTVGGATNEEHLARLQRAVRDEYVAHRANQPAGIAADDLRDSRDWFLASEGAAALGPALERVNEDVAAAHAKLTDAVAAQKVDPTDVAAQLAADRAWRRQKGVFDSVSGVPKLVAAAQEWVANAPDVETPVINEELKAYLTSRGAPTDWVDQAVAARIPGSDDQRAEAALKAKRRDVLAANNASLLRSFKAGTPPPELVDAYGPGITAQPYSNGEPYSPTGA